MNDELKEAVSYNLNDLEGPRLMEVIEDATAPDLFVPFSDGTVRFWVRTRPRLYLIGTTQQESFNGAEGHGFRDFRDMTGAGTIGQNFSHTVPDASMFVEIAQRFKAQDWKRWVLHDDIMDQARVAVDDGQFMFSDMIVAVYGLTRRAADFFAQPNISDAALIANPPRVTDPLSLVVPPITVRSESLFRRWLMTTSVAVTAYHESLDEMVAKRMQAGDALGVADESTYDEESSYLLPACVETPVLLKFSARSLLSMGRWNGRPLQGSELSRVASEIVGAAEFAMPSLYRRMH